ncbi:hypothetical protein CY34DRAFT_17006 [Suillus luteus UH-Slu-Lm8-n1]|uniref:Uncharacterized protein n=1 Tax=Suillus luteus UH-Slu-Lm8-n1 TaxID=930992 RepID=A0A0D0ABN6_9AGAM|nr:hypothetical protein CY34DRAFT_17006 [Suillus luteus UH-Slu-Lm8-n1]
MKLKNEDGNIVQEIGYKSVIGHAAVYSKQGIFIVDNATDGFTLYHLDDNGEPIRTFETDLPSMPVTKQVVFREEGNVVVGGSNHGQKTRQILETLHQADAGLVQIISTSIMIGQKNVT